MPKTSFSGSRSRFIDRPGMIEELRLLCRRAGARRKDIERVILFGSFARGEAGPRSDADLLVVLADSHHTRRMDRIPKLLEAFSPMPVALDIVPLTRAELEQALKEEDPWTRTILKEGLELLRIPGPTSGPRIPRAARRTR